MAEEAAGLLGIWDLMNRGVNGLSSEQIRRVLVARALVHDPEILFLDEPYTSLDITARHSFSERVRELARRGHASSLITHELSKIPPEIGRIILVKDDRILADGPKAGLFTASGPALSCGAPYV